jgi:hypothetical protein
MAFNFVVETGIADSDANSYADVEFADDYVEANIYAEAWALASEETKQKLLVRASKNLDARVNWYGTRVDEDSGLRWPRAGVYDRDGFLIAEDVIPEQLQEAVVEFAVYLSTYDWTSPRDADQFKELQVDVIDIKFDPAFRKAAIPDTVVLMLEGLGDVNGGKRPGFKKIIRV